MVFYLDLSFIFLLELKRCSMARGCLQGVKYLMFAFNLLFWVSGGGPGRRSRWVGVGVGWGQDTRDTGWGCAWGRWGQVSAAPGGSGTLGVRQAAPGRPPCILRSVCC